MRISDWSSDVCSSDLLLDMDVKPSDNFFDIGGNSMLAIQMSERVVKETGVRIKLMQLAVQSLGVIAADLPDVAVPGARSSRSRLLGRCTRLLGPASVQIGTATWRERGCEYGYI